MTTQHIVFIHGMFTNAACWDRWIPHFESLGFTCHAPSYPLKEGSPKNLRDNIGNGKIETLRFGHVYDSLVTFLSRFDEPPILIGHSLGGLLVQLLIQDGYGKAGVCIQPAPPFGVLSFKPSFVLPFVRLVSPFADRTQPYLLPPEEWYHRFANGMSIKEQVLTYERYVAPESRMVAVDLLSPKNTLIDFSKPHVPLLLTAGSDDRALPASLHRSNWKRYTDKESVTDFKEFRGNHFAIASENSTEMIDFITDWLSHHKIA